MLDIVIPNGNEEAFCDMAKKLGFTGLIFLYTRASQMPKFPKTFPCYAIVEKRENGLPFAAFSSENDREMIESRNAPDMIIGPEWQEKTDKMHYRVSGLNHLLCRLAAEKKIAIAPRLARFWVAGPVPRAVAMGRLSQNVLLCRKYKCKTVIASFAEMPWQMRSAQDMASFLVEAGMRADEAKKSLLRQYLLR